MAQPPDPTEQNRWRPLRQLLDAMDADIARLYTERGITGVRPRFVAPLIRLGRRGGMTIRQLADSLEVTHSAMSQTVAALRRDGLVSTAAGADARTREVTLTERARELLPFLEAEWRATEQVVAELDAEIPYALTRVVQDLQAALQRRSFHDRIADRIGDA
ncbi:MarR family winged helix-turn-helix transcriptional regulator [Pseudonocardia adelaidensis]|uniref:HTH marR-type domain-containing protein n=1 Tax=Pseudonocardia adelaidensis TaxID=648754 RepID=A0ABP9P2N4_9PSEU